MLKHQTCPALLRAQLHTLRRVQPSLVRHPNVALHIGGRPEPSNGAQHAGFPTARRPDKRYQLARVAVKFGLQPNRADRAQLHLQALHQRSCKARPRWPTRSKASTRLSASKDTPTSASAITWADCKSMPCTLS